MHPPILTVNYCICAKPTVSHSALFYISQGAPRNRRRAQGESLETPNNLTAFERNCLI